MRLLLLVGLVVLSCGSAAPSREIVIAMNEFAFLPDTIEVSPGERVRLTLKNIGRVDHEFAPDQRARAFGVPHIHLGHSESASRDWTAPAKADELQIVCGLPGHREAGMVARIIVR